MGARSREIALVVGAGLAMLLLFLVVRESLTDDAYITLAYAKNLALHLHWGLIPQEVANSATSPLHVVLLGLVTAATRISGEADAILALGVVSVAAAMAMAWAWTRITRHLGLPLPVAVIGVALVLVNPFLLSSVGLEVLLIPAFLTTLLAMALERRVGWFGVLAGLTVLVRLDLIVFVLVLAAATPAIRRQWRRALGGAVLVAGPWFVCSWLVLGSAVPDTLVLKVSQPGLFGTWTYATGPLMYYDGQPIAVLLAFLPAVLGVLALAGWLVARIAGRPSAANGLSPLDPAAGLAAGAVAYYAVFALMGVGPYHWYFVPLMTSLSTFAVIAAGTWLAKAQDRARLRPGLVVGLLGLLAFANLGTDLRQGVPWSSPVIFGNWASARDYARLATTLRERVGSATVHGPGEVGALAYHCECAITDEFSDRGATVEKIERVEDDAPPPVRVLLNLNYLWLDRSRHARPVDYLLTYTPGPGSGRDVWEVHSGGAGTGTGHFTLRPARVPRRPEN